LRRLLFLTEKKISRPYDWVFRNETLTKRVAYRKSNTIHTILIELQEALIAKIIEEIMSPKNIHRFPNYREMDLELLRWRVAMHYHLITASVRNRDRAMIPNFMKEISHKRYMEGFQADEVKDLIFLTARIMKESLLGRQELKDAKQRVDDYIILTSQFAADELADNFEVLKSQAPKDTAPVPKEASLVTIENIRQIITGLEDIAPDSLLNRLGKEVLFKNYGVLITLTQQKE